MSEHPEIKLNRNASGGILLKEQEISIFWFRRDLRLHDNAGLYHALSSGKKVLPVFIFDTEILDLLENREDRRVEFIHLTLGGLNRQLEVLSSGLLVLHGTPADAFKKLLKAYRIGAVYANHDYEPAAIRRDEQIRKMLQEQEISFKTYKDQVIFEKSEVTKDDGQPYNVFTPYMRKWKNLLSDFYLHSYPVERYFSAFVHTQTLSLPLLEELGFRPAGQVFSVPELLENTITAYDRLRDFPSIAGTSRMSVHLRFGTVSIRELAQKALQLNEQWLNELIWREFYVMILFHYPHVVSGSFKKQYDRIPWRNNEREFEAWCSGKTGYPIVDAGMRELNATGFMHNRVRMITASFLVKHLLIDWRWGEAYFAEKLLDYDLAANNGGWQWAAGSGCDAAPYFRVFNPYEQTRRFDKDLAYIRRWVPEFEEPDYPLPLVEHKAARERVLRVYKRALATE